MSFEHYEVQFLKCSKHSTFCSYVVWISRTLVQGCGLKTISFEILWKQWKPLGWKNLNLKLPLKIFYKYTFLTVTVFKKSQWTVNCLP